MCVSSLLDWSLVCQQIWSAQKTGNYFPANNHPISLLSTFYSIDWLCCSSERLSHIVIHIQEMTQHLKLCQRREEGGGKLTDQLPRLEDQKVSNFDPANFPYKPPQSVWAWWRAVYCVVKIEFTRNSLTLILWFNFCPIASNVTNLRWSIYLKWNEFADGCKLCQSFYCINDVCDQLWPKKHWHCSPPSHFPFLPSYRAILKQHSLFVPLEDQRIKK